MKRRELIKLFEKNGWTLARHGGSHDIYSNGIYNIPVPRHPDINEMLAKSLIRKYGLK